ncbi:hypothetical protein L3Q82_020987 [Scortum barcoo]|uniref:Uncharacterized protein n=1 Tax=Scortum barcoo TaxID=214431 RepID=A0ACB8V9P4_9TELE|nr:hypothetical protein L3Q82_020987 [Scortum barcoo]
MTFNRLLSTAVSFSKVGSRSVFTSSKPDTANPNWLRVGLAFGTSAFLWGLRYVWRRKNGVYDEKNTYSEA